jgi:hypothetical protein
VDSLSPAEIKLARMSVTELISSIDAEIARLQQARTLLAEGDPAKNGAAKRGRPAKKKRILSAEARAKIAAAQKKRWAAVRKLAK